MSITTAPTIPLAVTDRGRGGPTLLCVPGWCGNRTVFDTFVTEASGRRRVVSVDLPDHGDSPARDDVTTEGVVDDLIRTITGLDLGPVIPVALSHAGWAAIELRRRLGPESVPAVVLLDWMVLGAPPVFGDALAGLSSPAWSDVRASLFHMWTDGLDLPAVTATVEDMSRYGARHWQRAGREIAAGFTAAPVPLATLDELQPCPTLHLYAQPADDTYLTAQQVYAATHPWFSVSRLEARSHFPMLEVPEALVGGIEHFLHRTVGQSQSVREDAARGKEQCARQQQIAGQDQA